MAEHLSSPAIWVDDQKSFDHVCSQLKKNRHLGVDTESNSLHAYQEHVCLIQFTDAHADYLIDAMAEVDLTGLSEIFSDENIEKIFHAAEYDILCLKRDYRFEFSHLFDTMQAARILGMEKLGLSGLLSDLLDIDQGKSFQKADWGKRPVPEEMRQYARMDTHYLLSLRNILAEKLKEKNLMDLAREDFQRLCQLQHTQRDAPLYTQVGGHHLLDPQSLAVLEELCQFRDRRAEKLNRPHFKVIGNNILLAVAQALPHSEQELRKIEDVSPKILERYQKEILDAIKKGLANPPIQLEKHRRPSQAYIDRLQKLQDWRKNEGSKMGVQSDIVLPRDILEEIAAKNPQDLRELDALMVDVPWRLAHYGRDIIKIIKKVNSP
jgi:ribonuclease D